MASDEFHAVERLFRVDAPTDEESSRMYDGLIDYIANTETASQIRAVVPDETPGALASWRMRRAFDAHVRGPAKRRHRRAGIATVVSVGAVVALWIGVSMIGRLEPAEALLNIAEATARLPTDEFANAAVERRIDQLALQVEPSPVLTDETGIAFLLPISQIIRTSPDGSFQVETSYGTLEFFEPVAADVAALLQEPYPVEQSDVATFPPSEPSEQPLSDDAVLLERYLFDAIRRFGPPEVPEAAQLLELVASLYTETLPTSRERAAMLTVIGRTDSIEFASHPDGTVTATTTYDYEDGTPVSLTLRFDPQGWLVRSTESLIEGYLDADVPPGTPAFDTRLSVPTILGV